MIATDDLVLIELADGNYVPIPRALSRTFRGLIDGDPIYDGAFVPDLPRAYPGHLDAEDYLTSLTCASCGDVADDLSVCVECSLRGCSCLILTDRLDCTAGSVCDPCADAHVCRVCTTD